MATITRKWITAGILLLTLLVLFAGTWLIARIFFSPAWGWPGGMMDGSWSRSNQYLNRDFESNGEQIYFTGTSRTGPPITFQMGNGFRMPMMRGQMACVDCHGENGEGGTLNMMMMGTFDVPNIKYAHLTEEEHSEGEEEHAPYKDETIKRAITEGVNPDGEPLDWPMPRWNMTDQQLNDMITFLKSLH